MPDLVVGDALCAVTEHMNGGLLVQRATVTAVSAKQVRISGGEGAFGWRTVLRRDEAETYARTDAGAYVKYAERAQAEIARLELRCQQLRAQVNTALGMGQEIQPAIPIA